MADRPRNACDFKGVGQFGTKFRYVSRQYLWTVRWGNGCVTTLLLEVFTQRNFVAEFIRLKLNVIKNQKSLFSYPLGDLGVTYALHL